MSEDSNRDLSGLYRAGSGEEPPEWLDAKILAAAGAKGGEHKGTALFARPWRWMASLALAAVVALCVSLVILMQTDTAETGISASRVTDATKSAPSAVHRNDSFTMKDEPVPSPDRQLSASQIRSRDPDQDRERRIARSAGNVTSQAAPAQQQVQSEVDSTAEREVNGETKRPAPLAGTTRSGMVQRADPSASPVQPASPPSAIELDRSIAREKFEANKAAGAAVAGRQPDSTGRPATRVEHNDPEQWLRDIERLRREGREQEARTSLEDFRKRFPAYVLPDSLK